MMPKFIKFISENNILVIRKVETIETIMFYKNLSLISITGISGLITEYKYEDIKDFKQQCDAIMEQLEI